MSFRSLGLPDPILRALDDAGYQTPTEIQAQAIPPALEGRDVIGRAQTGTGKTAAFAIPILVRLYVRSPRAPVPVPPPKPAPSHARRKGDAPSHRRPVRALVLTPTRELCVQNDASFREYGKYLGARSLAVYGGVRIDRQLKKLHAGVDVVIATPGRLLDHLNRGTIDLRHVEVFVLDEVDRMFDMGFIQDVRKIIARLPEKRQTLLFSATIPPEVQRLAERVQTDAVHVEIGEQQVPIETITQYLFPVPRDRKLELLRFILENDAWDMVLVFCGRKDHAEFVTRRLLHYGIDAAQLHSNLSQTERRDALAGFKAGEHRVLVATDIAARGLDIEGISHVLNYDVPRNPEDYIHRIGRTGRAEATGDAVTFVAFDEEEYVDRIEQHIGSKLERRRYKDFDHGVGRFEPAKTGMSRLRRGSRKSARKRYV